jgi:hypothetical protein
LIEVMVVATKVLAAVKEVAQAAGAAEVACG